MLLLRRRKNWVGQNDGFDSRIEFLAMRTLPRWLFATRWVQLPLYIGLVVAQVIYVYQFWMELAHLIDAVLGHQDSLDALVAGIGYRSDAPITQINESIVMLVVLGLIDVVMISNLLIMVIVGGYDTFVSRVSLEGHPDQPEWLDHVNASVLKVKLAAAIIGISSIHLLKTFINVSNYSEHTVMWQTLIHGMFLLSAMALAQIDRMMQPRGDH